MFASDVVIILIIFFGVSFILFGKEKMLKGFKNPRYNNEYNNFHYCHSYLLPLGVNAVILYIWFFSITCYSILNNFYTPLVNLMFISLLYN